MKLPPLDLYLSPDDAEASEVLSYIVANLLHMLEVADSPSVADIHFELGPYATMDGELTAYLLLRGLKLRVYDTYRPEPHIHDHEDEIRAQRARYHAEAYRRAGDRLHLDDSQLFLADIMNAITREAAIITYWAGEDDSDTPVLIYGFDGRMLKTYSPLEPDAREYSPTGFVDRWRRECGMYACWRGA